MFGRNVVISVLKVSLDSGLLQEIVLMHEYLSPGRFIDSDPVSYTHLTLPTIYSV